MSETTDIYVTPSTSLVLLKNLSSIVNVYLRPYTTASFSVTIRDTTGLSSLTTQPVRISTIDSAKFVDGGSLYLLNQPYGLVNVSLRNSNVWQINHTSGQTPATAAATVVNLSVNQLYVGFQSTVQKFTSTLIVESLTTPNPISVTGPFIVSNLSTPGFVLFQQNLNVYGDATMRNIMDVNRNAFLISSFEAVDVQPVNYPSVVYSSVGIGGNVSFGGTLSIQSTLTLRSTIQINTVQVTLSTLDRSTELQGGLRVASNVSTVGSLLIGANLTLEDSFVLGKDGTSEGRLSTPFLHVGGSLNILSNASTLNSVDVLSSVHVNSTMIVQTTMTFQSSLGLVGACFPSSFSTLSFSTLGSLETFRLEILSTASVQGNVSTTLFQTFSTMSVGNDVFTPATISSLNTSMFNNSVSVKGNASFLTVFTSTVGIGQDLSVRNAITTSTLSIVGNTTIANSLLIQSDLDTTSNVGVRSTVTIYGDLTVIGPSEISSFLVNSFLLNSTLRITDTFRASTLIASTMSTSVSRFFTDSAYTPASAYVQRLEGNNIEAKNLYVSSVQADSFYAGSTNALADSSRPIFALNVKTQFVEGLSSFDVNASYIEAQSVEGSLFGNVNYLSNVAIPFSNISGITLSLSTLQSDSLYGSSFQTSTFINTQFLYVQSSLNTSYLRLDAQGFSPDATVNQILNQTSNVVTVNRNLYFDRTTNNIGLFVSSPQFTFDVSGLVYASNIVYSSINPLTVRAEGTVVLSTVYVSSSFVRDSLQYSGDGIHILSRTIGGTNPYMEIKNLSAYNSNLLGIYDWTSSIVLNTGVSIYPTQQVYINGFRVAPFQFFSPLQPLDIQPVTPTTNLDVQYVLQATDVFVSSGLLFEGIQSPSLLSRNLQIHRTPMTNTNQISTSFEKLFLNEIVTVQTSIQLSNRNMGICTANPEFALDVRGNAYVSTATISNLRANFVAMGFQEF